MVTFYSKGRQQIPKNCCILMLKKMSISLKEIGEKNVKITTKKVSQTLSQ